MSKKKITQPEVLDIGTVSDTCHAFMKQHNLIEVLNLKSWKIKFKVMDQIDPEGMFLGTCQYDRAYNLAEIHIAVEGHETLEDIKDTLVHELCHIILAEIDSSARDMTSTMTENMQAYIQEQLHVARERSVNNLAVIFRSIYK